MTKDLIYNLLNISEVNFRWTDVWNKACMRLSAYSIHASRHPDPNYLKIIIQESLSQTKNIRKNTSPAGNDVSGREILQDKMPCEWLFGNYPIISVKKKKRRATTGFKNTLSHCTRLSKTLSGISSLALQQKGFWWHIFLPPSIWCYQISEETMAGVWQRLSQLVPQHNPQKRDQESCVPSV